MEKETLNFLTKCLPESIRKEIIGAVKEPPTIARQGGYLFGARRDHIAIAVENFSEGWLIGNALLDNGAEETDSFVLWPDEYSMDTDLPPIFKKYMGVYEVGPETIVILAPYYSEDLIAKTILKCGSPTIHHIAYRVDDIDHAMQAICDGKDVEPISKIARDKDKLDQVFIRVETDYRIVELIRRYPGFEDSFTVENIKTLTQGESGHSRNK